jgi:hypothetical protein
MKKLTPEELSAVSDAALAAFWRAVARRFPKAKTGDLSALTTVRFTEAAEEAIQEWTALNCP